MFGITHKVYNNLMEYFNSNKDIKKVILFGSRAKGNFKNNSDIDICIEYCGKNKIDLIDEIDKLVGIYSCDVLFYDSLKGDIKTQIESYGIEIYRNKK